MNASARPSFRLGAKVAAFLGASALLLSASTASAQLIAYEGFDYGVGTDNVGTQTGGSGFAAGWTSSAGTESVQSGSLGYTDGLGNALVTTGNSGFFMGGATANASDIIRTMSSNRIDGTTTWVSFVADRLGSDFYWAASVQLRSGNTGAATEKITVGELSENNAAVGADAANNWWGLYNQAGLNATTANSADGFLVTDQSLILLRIDNLAGATDTVRMWINPTLSLIPSDASALVTLTGLDLNFDRIRIFSRQGDATHAQAQFVVDEVRIGETFADVTPYLAIPEPTTYAAILGGLTLGIAALRRYRRANRG